MAKVKRDDLVEHCRQQLGTPYVFGAKGEIMTQARINSLAASYPSMFTSSYIRKAQAFIGQKCLDCSGLISDKTKLIRGSSQYMETAVEKVPLSKLTEKHLGWALWRQGHIGVFVGNGYCIECKGINYGCVQTVAKNGNWTYVLKLCDIDYSDPLPGEKKKDGWSKENGIWYYYENGNTVKKDWRELNGHWYYFDEKGRMQTGWIQGKGGEWYWCDDSPDESRIGKMVTDRVIYDCGHNYYLDKNGVMAEAGKTVTFKVGFNGRLSILSVR